MTLAVLELNDQSLLIQAEGGPLHAEPGFARLGEEGIETGEIARATAWSEPQHSFNQYWCHLNQTPMAARQKFARHHADIAFAQLSSLWQQAGPAESLLLLVPGSFTDDRLSLLLGMAGALPAEVVAIIDSALAACLAQDTETLFVDMQLHQTVLSLCRPLDGRLEIAEQETVTSIGAMQILNSAARNISNLLIDSARYDPLHASQSEQAIYDQLPGWLARLRFESEVSTSLPTEKGELPFIMRRDAIKQGISERLSSVRAFLARHSNAHMLLSHGSSLLAGLAEEFDDADVAGHALALENVMAQRDEILSQVDGIYRITALAGGDSELPETSTTGGPATHILFGHRALPLTSPVSIHLDDDSVSLAAGLDHSAALTLVLNNRTLEAVHRSDGLDVTIPAECRRGDSVLVAGHRLRLIEVQGA
jgi:hypothetical protein